VCGCKPELFSHSQGVQIARLPPSAERRNQHRLSAMNSTSITRDATGRTVVATLYAMMTEEILQPQYDKQELSLFHDPVNYYGRYLDPETRNYALHNAVSNISAAVRYFQDEDDTPVKVVDLGCGLGMQSIIFAALGWEVLGIDLLPSCIDLCRKRQSYYEARLGQRLNLKFIAADFRNFDPNSLGGKYNRLFSMSAFVHIPPLEKTVSTIASMLRDTSRVFLWDQNPTYLFRDRIAPRHRHIPRPDEILQAFADHGFRAGLLRGACGVPRQFWASTAFCGAASKANAVLTRNLRLSFTYILGVARNGLTVQVS
jgi:2-polyprenyl-3-methyl-5-hydroxy-6-metoxy-1,4-benzoquinol methylase